MCHKICKKCCGMFLFAALAGIALYAIGCRKGSGACKEAAEELREKKDRVRQACRKMKDETMEIADDMKFAAGSIREDLKDMRDSAASVFESGDRA